MISPAPKYVFINFVQVLGGGGGGLLVINGAYFVFLWTDLKIVQISAFMHNCSTKSKLSDGVAQKHYWIMR